MTDFVQKKKLALALGGGGGLSGLFGGGTDTGNLLVTTAPYTYTETVKPTATRKPAVTATPRPAATAA